MAEYGIETCRGRGGSPAAVTLSSMFLVMSLGLLVSRRLREWSRNGRLRWRRGGGSRTIVLLVYRRRRRGDRGGIGEVLISGSLVGRDGVWEWK